MEEGGTPARQDAERRDQPGQVRRAGAAVARIPMTVWVITGLWAALLLGASVLWPMSYGYDEPQHIDMAYVYSAHPFHFYGPGQLPPTLANLGMQRSLPGYPPRQRLADVAIPPRGQRPSFAQLGGHTFQPSGQPNQMVQHPPLYYWLAALVLRAPGVSHLAWDLQVWLMRLLSVALMLPLPALCWATARRLLVSFGGATSGDGASRLALVAAVIPLTAPNLIRDGASVTNDTLLILTTSIVLYLCSRVLTGDLTRRTAIGLSVSLAAALWTKGFSLVLPPVVLAAYLVGAWPVARSWAARLRAVLSPLLIVAIGGVVGGLWWLRNLIDYGSVQINGFGPGFERQIYGPPDNHGTIGRFIPEFLTDFASRIWGGIGLPDLPSPGPLITYGWLFVVLLGVLAALCLRGSRRARSQAAVLIAVPILSVLVAAQASYSTFEHWSTGTHGSQGRYVYQAFVAIAALATIGWSRVFQPRIRAMLATLVLVGAIITNATTWLLILDSWYAPTRTAPGKHGLGTAVGGLLRWSPLPRTLTILLVAILPAALSVTAVVVVGRDARRASRARVAADRRPAAMSA